MIKENLTNNPKIPNILIVDDMPANLSVLGDILRGEGYKTRPVPNGKLALQVIEKEKPDLILLDIMMPDMDGFEVCKQIKINPTFNDIPIIFISALNDTDNIVKAFQHGGADYIIKPFKVDEVKVRVENHLKLYFQSKELKELNATKDKFFSIIAHDLRGPLSGFLGLTEVMSDKMAKMQLADFRDFATTLNLSAINMYRLLENLLEWAKMQQGLIPFIPKEALLQPIINESIETIENHATDKGISISYDIPQGMIVYADTNILKSIFRNLVTNAIKFTEKGGHVSILAQQSENNEVLLAVKDNGIGISSDLIENLFQIGFQSNRIGTDGEPSSGLGLLLCKDFIEQHHGKIWVESKEFEGTTFYFTLPNKISN